MDKDLFINAGIASYGNTWQTMLSKDLSFTDKSIRNWVSGKTPVPISESELIRVLRNRIDQIESIIMELIQSIISDFQSTLQSYNDLELKRAKKDVEVTDYNSIHSPKLGDEDKQFSELYNELNELIDIHGQGLFETTQDIMKKHNISNNIDDLNDDDSVIYEKLLEIYHEYDNDFRADILELINSHPKLAKFTTLRKQ